MCGNEWIIWIQAAIYPAQSIALDSTVLFTQMGNP